MILDVARRFPVIRFDAAMVLARKHIQRLWWPLPGGVSGDSIPSRAQYAISQEEFDRRMPNEFWREVVDRVAAEVPDTLLLAEAFWMLEGYFVRTLGMHRVYNSAFMHMLRDENGAGYRKLIRETLEFDPEILKRYVNFMSNPDEETALEQFGKGDKYFGVATVMATLPGLPMLGHGQVEGFAEKYGMEFRRATARRAARSVRSSSGTIARSSRCCTGGRGSPRRTSSCCTTSSPTAAAWTRTCWRIRTAADRRDRWSSTTPASGRHRARSANRPPSRASRRAARSACSADRWPRVSVSRTTLRCSSRSATRGPGCSTSARRRSCGSAVCGCRSTPTRATCSGSSTRSTTGPRASGGAWPSGWPAPAFRRSTTRWSSSSWSPSTRRSGRCSRAGTCRRSSMDRPGATRSTRSTSGLRRCW